MNQNAHFWCKLKWKILCLRSLCWMIIRALLSVVNLIFSIFNFGMNQNDHFWCKLKWKIWCLRSPCWMIIRANLSVCWCENGCNVNAQERSHQIVDQSIFIDLWTFRIHRLNTQVCQLKDPWMWWPNEVDRVVAFYSADPSLIPLKSKVVVL